MPTLLDRLTDDRVTLRDQVKVGGRFVSADIMDAITEIERLIRLALVWRNFKTDPPPGPGSGVGMIIYAKRKNHDGRRPVGIAYRSKSGTWCDSVGFEKVDIDLWMLLPEVD